MKVRAKIEKEIGRKLKFFTGWVKTGEAHVTTISPPEYSRLQKYIKIDKINQIAHDDMDIQSSDLTILGVGSAKRDIDGKSEETFFIIVDSAKLRAIRDKIYQEYKDAGGNPSKFDPTWFFPHITIGYTEKDLHENRGVYKDINHSYDERFKLTVYR